MSTINLQITLNHPDAVSNTVRYARIDNSNNPTYTTLTGITNGVLTIQNLPNGQYRVGTIPIYADGRVCAESFQETAACSGIVSFSAVLSGGNISVAYTADVSVPYIQININYPNGGTFSHQYASTGSGTVAITPPAGLYGDYSVTIQPVCDTSTGFLGTPSAPAIVHITAPNNSTLTNNTAGAMAPVSLTSYGGDGTNLVFNAATIAGTGGSSAFYIADDNYTSLVVAFGSGTVASSSLVTGSGAYTGVVSGGTITFSNVVVSSGVAITTA